MIIYKNIGNYTEPKKTAYVQKKGKSFFKWCEFYEYNKNQWDKKQPGIIRYCNYFDQIVLHQENWWLNDKSWNYVLDNIIRHVRSNSYSTPEKI